MSEAKNPRRDTAFALFATLIVCAAIYALIQCVVVEVLGSSATSDRPLADVARLSMGNRGAALVAIGAMLSVWGYLGAKLLGMPRLTFALAQQHELPPLFCAVNPRFHTPWFSIVFYAAVIWILAIIGSFAWNVTLSVIARLFYYGVICAAVIALRHRQAEAAEFRLPGGALFPVLGIGVCIMLATQVGSSGFVEKNGARKIPLLLGRFFRRGDEVKAPLPDPSHAGERTQMSQGVDVHLGRFGVDFVIVGC